jgi:hypothetical protein
VAPLKEMSPGEERKILTLISGGSSQSLIVKQLKRPKSTVSGWLKTLEFTEDKIILDVRSRTKFYVLTRKGGQRLKELQSTSSLGDPDDLVLSKGADEQYDLHAYFCTYPIIKHGEIFDPNPTQMQNWVRERLKLPNATVQTNGKVSVTISPSILLRGPNPALLWMRAQAICDSTAKMLEMTFGFVLGRGELSNHHLEVSSSQIRPVAEELGYIKGEFDASAMSGEAVFQGKDVAKSIQGAQSLKQVITDTPKQMGAVQSEVVYLREQVNMLMNVVAQLAGAVEDTKALATETVMALGKTLEAQNRLIEAARTSAGKDKDVPGYR